jgi:hypothetical protein
MWIGRETMVVIKFEIWTYVKYAYEDFKILTRESVLADGLRFSLIVCMEASLCFGLPCTDFDVLHSLQDLLIAWIPTRSLSQSWEVETWWMFQAVTDWETPVILVQNKVLTHLALLALDPLQKVNMRDWLALWRMVLVRKEMAGGVVLSVWRRWTQIFEGMHLAVVSCVNRALT